MSKRVGLKKCTSNILENSLEIDLCRRFPDKEKEIQEAVKEFNDKTGGIIELADKLKAIVGATDYTEFVNSQFSTFTTAFNTKSAVDTLKRRVHQDEFVSFAKNYKEDPRSKWTILSSKVDPQTKLPNLSWKDSSLVYSKLPRLCCLTNKGAYTMSMKNFVFKKLNYIGRLPSISGLSWRRISCGKVSLGGTSPLPREGHSATMISDNEIFLFGGSQHEELSDQAYVLDLDFMHWYVVGSENEKDIPSKRILHSAVSVWNNVYIFGGEGEDYQDLNDLYSMELTAYPVDGHESQVDSSDNEKKYVAKWAKVEASSKLPPARSGHS